MKTNENKWKPLEISGDVVKSMESIENHWKSLEINGNQ